MDNRLPQTLPSIDVLVADSAYIRGLRIAEQGWATNDGAVLVHRVNPFTGANEYVAYYQLVFVRDADNDAERWYKCACGAEHNTPTCPFEVR